MMTLALLILLSLICGVLVVLMLNELIERIKKYPTYQDKRRAYSMKARDFIEIVDSVLYDEDVYRDIKLAILKQSYEGYRFAKIVIPNDILYMVRNKLISEGFKVETGDNCIKVTWED